MRKFSLFILAILINSSIFAICRPDSTVVKFEDNNSAYGHIRRITINTYHLDSGTVDISTKEQEVNSPWSPDNYSSSAWSKTISYKGVTGLIDSIITLNGSVSGWNNSSSTLYTYNTSGSLLSETYRVWNGSSWITQFEHFKLYDIDNRITEEFSRSIYNGVIANIKREIYNYSGSNLTSIDYQSGNASSWNNESQYVFYYTGNIRSSLDVNSWNGLITSWQTSGHYDYLPVSNPFQTTIKTIHTDTLDGVINSDTSYYMMDTLQNILKEHFVSISGSGNSFYGNINENTYQYINGIKCNTVYFSSDAYYDISNTDTSVSYDCKTHVIYHFDSQGRMTGWNDYSRCGNPRGASGSQEYDNNGFLFHTNAQGWSMVSEWNYDTWYTHIENNNFQLILPPWEENLKPCKNQTFQPTVIPAGGCSPYHYQWTPSVGLSNDTIVNPEITISDTTIYTITVTDNIGNTASLNYAVTPGNLAPLFVDSTSCTSCAALLSTTNLDYAYYEWYRNNVLTQYNNVNTFTADSSGYYFVAVTDWNNGCRVISDTIFLQGKMLSTLSASISNDTICEGDSISITASGAVSYLWMPGNITAPTITITPNQSTNYVVYGTNQLGIIDSLIIPVTVNFMPDRTVTVSGSVLLSTQPDVQYQWINCNNGMLPLQNEMDQGYFANYYGSYAVILNNKGCIDTSACYLIAPLNVSDNYPNSSPIIYPNPVSSKLFYRTDSNMNNCSYSINDNLGRIVMKGELNNGTTSIDIEKLITGHYFFNVIGSGLKCSHFVKE